MATQDEGGAIDTGLAREGRVTERAWEIQEDGGGRNKR